MGWNAAGVVKVHDTRPPWGSRVANFAPRTKPGTRRQRRAQKLMRRRRRRQSIAAALVALVALVAVAVATTDRSDTHHRVQSPPATDHAPGVWRRATVSIAAQPRSGSEDDGSFRVECTPSHRAQVDPIVAPRLVSHHVHEFFGNTSTSSRSTYATMRRASTTCTASGDRAAYWAPALQTGGGRYVRPERAIFYYRNRPVEYGETVPFPPDFRMIAGGPDSFPHAYWTCDGESDTGLESRRDFVPDCGGEEIKAHVFFPSCWDGEHLDAPDHRSHVAYGLDADGNIDGTNPESCPTSHPVKLPQLDFRVQYPVSDGSGYAFADGEVLPHADFWNTWDQRELVAWIEKCLHGGQSCKLADGEARRQSPQ